MPADHPTQQPFMAQPVEATAFSVALAGSKDEAKVARLAGFEKPRLERGKQFVGHADADKARGGEGIAGLDQGGSVSGGNDLVCHGLSLGPRRDIVQRQTPPRSRLDRSGAIQYA